jgi:hypothetical protein
MLMTSTWKIVIFLEAYTGNYFDICDSLTEKVHIIICCIGDLTTDHVIVTLFLHQYYLYSVFTDAMHLQIPAEDGAAANNQCCSMFFSSHPYCLMTVHSFLHLPQIVFLMHFSWPSTA